MRVLTSLLLQNILNWNYSSVQVVTSQFMMEALHSLRHIPESNKTKKAMAGEFSAIIVIIFIQL
jgi:hypothetical protein